MDPAMELLKWINSDENTYLRRDGAEVLMADEMAAEGLMYVDHWNDAMEPLFELTLEGQELLRGL